MRLPAVAAITASQSPRTAEARTFDIGLRRAYDWRTMQTQTRRGTFQQQKAPGNLRILCSVT